MTGSGRVPTGGPVGDGVPPDGPRRGKRRILPILGVVFGILLSYGVWRYFWAPDPIAETPVGQAVAGLLQRNDKGESIRAARAEEKDRKPFPILAAVPDMPAIVSPSAINLLVMARDVEANLYDTLLIASMNPDNGSIRLINVPRDLYVQYSDEAVSRISKKIKGINSEPALRKINAAHKLGKLIKYREDDSRFGTPDYDFTADLLEEMFSLSIDDYVFINHDAFRRIVDEFGGVKIDVPYGMNYHDPYQDLDIDLDPGPQLLDGADAEGFVRFRKGRDENGKYFEIGDLGRKENQNLFVKAFLDQHLTVGNIGRLVSTANRYTEYVETSVVGDVKVGKYAQLAKTLVAAKLQVTPVTLETDMQKIGGHSHLVLAGGVRDSNYTGGSGSAKGGKDNAGGKASPAPQASPEPSVEPTPAAPGASASPEATGGEAAATATPSPDAAQPTEAATGGTADGATEGSAPGASDGTGTDPNTGTGAEPTPVPSDATPAATETVPADPAASPSAGG